MYVPEQARYERWGTNSLQPFQWMKAYMSFLKSLSDAGRMQIHAAAQILSNRHRNKLPCLVVTGRS
jgi:hypothetical protein